MSFVSNRATQLEVLERLSTQKGEIGRTADRLMQTSRRFPPIEAAAEISKIGPDVKQRADELKALRQLTRRRGGIGDDAEKLLRLTRRDPATEGAAKVLVIRDGIKTAARRTAWTIGGTVVAGTVALAANAYTDSQLNQGCRLQVVSGRLSAMDRLMSHPSIPTFLSAVGELKSEDPTVQAVQLACGGEEEAFNLKKPLPGSLEIAIHPPWEVGRPERTRSLFIRSSTDSAVSDLPSAPATSSGGPDTLSPSLPTDGLTEIVDSTKKTADDILHGIQDAVGDFSAGFSSGK
jgi:hypothetical protein